MTTRKVLRGAGITFLGLGLGFVLDTRPLYNEEAGRPPDDPLDVLTAHALNDSNLHLITRPFGELLRAYLVYLCSSSGLVISTTSLALSAFERIREVLPFGLGEVPWRCAEFIIRRTAFAMFAGGESAVGTFPLLDRLAAESTSGLLCYSAEAEAVANDLVSSEHLVQANVDETLRAIRAAGVYPTDRPAVGVRTTWTAIKLTGLVRDPSVLERASEALTSSSAYQRGQRLPPGTLFPASPLLSSEDETTLAELHDSLMRCGALARQLGVRVDIDAEQSWFQPAIDRYYELLAEAYNKVSDESRTPVIFQTYQCYRSDARERLHAEMRRADELGLAFGAKLVRGAYVDGENARAKRLKRPSPLWSSKAETDTCYNAAAMDVADQILQDLKNDAMAQTAAMFASHNSVSTRLVLERFRDEGLMRDHHGRLAVDERLRGRLVFGQLLGMADNLTAALTHLLSGDEPTMSKPDRPLPYVLKYIPYGEVRKVLPYLIRRAQENKQMLAGDSSRGGVRHERKAVGREIRRKLGF